MELGFLAPLFSSLLTRFLVSSTCVARRVRFIRNVLDAGQLVEDVLGQIVAQGVAPGAYAARLDNLLGRLELIVRLFILNLREASNESAP